MATTISGQTFANSDVVAGQKFYASNFLALIAQMQALNDELAAECISLGGTQDVSGVKTFTASPIVPDLSASDNSTKAANTKYVDAQVGTLGTMTPTSYAAEKSITLSNGLVLKFGEYTCTGTGEETVDFTDEGNTDFDNDCLAVFCNQTSTSRLNANIRAYTFTSTSFKTKDNVAGYTFNWLAIGY